MKDFGFDGNCDKFPVGMAYVPWQQFEDRKSVV